jgi:hypothetical protein
MFSSQLWRVFFQEFDAKQLATEGKFIAGGVVMCCVEDSSQQFPDNLSERRIALL